MKLFKSFFILFTLFFLCCDDVLCFKFSGRKRKNSSGLSSMSSNPTSSGSVSSGSFGSSDDGSDYVDSDREETPGRIFLVFKEGLLETQARYDFFTQINETCSDDNFRQQYLAFYNQETKMIHSLFMQSSVINLSSVRILSEDGIAKFNKVVDRLNKKFEEYLRKKEECYCKLYELIKYGMTDSLFLQCPQSEFLLQCQLLVNKNGDMKEYIKRRLNFLGSFCKKGVAFD